VVRVAFDTSGLGRWDSGLLAFLAQILDWCRERKIVADLSGLPAGVRRLLALAEAVPERAGARTREVRPGLFARVGKSALGLFAGVDEWFRFIGELTLACGRLARLRARFPWAAFALLVQQAGAEALGIVTLVSFLMGLILAFMGAVQLLRFGASIYVADLVGVGMAREMGAVMTAVVMAGRTGAAYAAQLGTMKVTQEIDAERAGAEATLEPEQMKQRIQRGIAGAACIAEPRHRPLVRAARLLPRQCRPLCGWG